MGGCGFLLLYIQKTDAEISIRFYVCLHPQFDTRYPFITIGTLSVNSFSIVKCQSFIDIL